MKFRIKKKSEFWIQKIQNWKKLKIQNIQNLKKIHKFFNS